MVVPRLLRPDAGAVVQLVLAGGHRSPFSNRQVLDS